MTDPTLLRRAIETVGIEKPSDYTLVLEELERLMDERLVERVARELAVEDGKDPDAMSHNSFEWWRHFVPKARAVVKFSGISALIRAATDLVQEMEEMGYGKTSDRALPGSYDNLLAALKEVNG